MLQYQQTRQYGSSVSQERPQKKHRDVAHGIGDTALIHFKISMRLLIFIEVRPIIYQKLQHFANINNLMLK